MEQRQCCKCKCWDAERCIASVHIRIGEAETRLGFCQDCLGNGFSSKNPITDGALVDLCVAALMGRKDGAR